MSRLDDLIEASRKIAALGVTRATLTRETSEREGYSNVPAAVHIDTSIVRPQTIGGGTVSWSFYVDCQRGHEAGLNTLLRMVCELINDATVVAATVRNAYEGKRAAEARAKLAEGKLASVLRPSGIRGRFLVRTYPSGEVWLLDPQKQESGWGLCFPSLDELWRAHPDLRPVSWVGGDLLVEPWVYQAPTVNDCSNPLPSEPTP